MRKQNKTQKNSLLAGKTPAQVPSLGAKNSPSGSYEHRLKAFMVANGMVLADNKEGLSHKDRVAFTDYLCHFHGMTRGGAANALSFEQFLPESLAKRLGNLEVAPAVEAEVMAQAHQNLRSDTIGREAETKVEDTTTEDSGSNSQEAGANTEGENNESTYSVESTESTQASEESSTESGDTDSSTNSEE